MRILIVLFFCLLSFLSYSSPDSFHKAKQIAGQIFKNHSKTLYCRCEYKGKDVDLASCGMENAHSKKRAHKVEWEHIMAAEHFGQQFECWRKPLCQHKNGESFKGRACCQKINKIYRHIEAELYNLWPESGLVNQARSNYRFGVISNHTPFYRCEIAINKSLRRVEPPDYAKGIVARAYLFMAFHYHLVMSQSQTKLFKAWNQQFPPDAWEKKWALKVASIEGYENPLIMHWGEYFN